MKCLSKTLIILVVIFLIFILFDIFTFYMAEKQIKNINGISSISIGFSSFIKHYGDFAFRKISVKQTNKMIIDGERIEYHEILNSDSVEKPILIFGCSFAYGYKISIEKTLHKVLAKYTSRPVYDRSYAGWGINQMLYQLSNEKFYEIIPEPEYVIYVYLSDHVRRLYQPCLYSIFQYYGAFYHLVNGKLMLKKTRIFYDRFNLVARTYDKFFSPYPKKNKEFFEEL